MTLNSDRHSLDSTWGLIRNKNLFFYFKWPQIWRSGGELDALNENKVIFEIWNDCQKKIAGCNFFKYYQIHRYMDRTLLT